MSDAAFVARYGPSAIVAGASEGIGEAFGRHLARRGLDLVLVARRQAPLERLAASIREAHGVRTRVVALDLARPDSMDVLRRAASDLEVGLLVYNAALSIIGPFLDQPLERHLDAVDVNVRGPLSACHAFGSSMADRGRGGIVLMSSMSGLQGTALVATYAATKAFDLVLAEGLYEELRGRGVDVLACCAGPTSTPGYQSSRPDAGGLFAPPVQDPDEVAREALDALGHRPSIIPGAANRLSAALLQRLLPRSRAVRAVGATMRRMYGRRVRIG